MTENRRNQRIRFNLPVSIYVGYGGMAAEGKIENLSQSGAMINSHLSPKIGTQVGCEFSIQDGSTIQVAGTVASRLGEMFGLRFQLEPTNQRQLEDAIAAALECGTAGALSVNEILGQKVIRVIGGLGIGLRTDFLYALRHHRIKELDLENLRAIDRDGLVLCLFATEKHNVKVDGGPTFFLADWSQLNADPIAMAGLRAFF